MSKKKKSVKSITHKEEKRTNIPTAEYENLMRNKDKKPIELKYPRNSDLDPQLVWRGKDDQDWSDLIVTAPPLYIQEKINPKHIVDDLMNQSKKRANYKAQEEAPDLFANMFDGELEPKAKTEFYTHDQNWTNRMILGDSLQVMASLAEREGLRDKVQCIYFDPPYGIKFGSNWQTSTRSRDVKDGKPDQISREPEMVKAFRDTWSDGIHSYLTYLRDRLSIARDLLNESGSIFVQIGDENVHRVRILLDEIFGEENFVSTIMVKKTLGLGSSGLGGTVDLIHFYAKNKLKMKFKPLKTARRFGEGTGYTFVNEVSGNFKRMNADEREKAHNIFDPNEVFCAIPLMSSGYTETCFYDFEFQSELIRQQKYSWKTTKEGVERLIKANRIIKPGVLPNIKLFASDVPFEKLSNYWEGTRASNPIYVVQTANKVIQNCLDMVTDPGDLVLDPTCGSGTTAFVSEHWGRRWITIDTSRVALALARARITGANYPYYSLADEEIAAKDKVNAQSKLRNGFKYKKVASVSVKSIANNTEIDVIWNDYKKTLDPLLDSLNLSLKKTWKEWDVPFAVDESWSDNIKDIHSKWWKARTDRQKEIDESIARNAETEYLYDKPYEDSSKVRVSGPFTVESLSPHKVIAVNDEGEFFSNIDTSNGMRSNQDAGNSGVDFSNVILEHLRTAGIQQAHKEDRIKFISINPFPGRLISGEGRYEESNSGNIPQKRAAIFIGPEYGTLGRADIVAAAREARDLKFDVLVCCAFNYDAHSSEIDQLADLPVLKARINPDLHMANELKNTGVGNLFVVFGEPDIEFIDVEDSKIQIKIHGVDVFHPSKGEVVSGGPESIAAWFIDTDYNEESFFVRHAYFLGANDPYKQLKSALKAEIDEEAWKSLYRDISRPFPKPETGRVAVKVINHLGDEVMKVFTID